MENKTEELKERVIDKSQWPDGPWRTEPDRLDWVHAGYACMILRHPYYGSLCGYVGVDNQHPLYEKDWNDANFPDFEVHYGINYTAKCTRSVCHTPLPGMPADVWWLGFDCNHGFDVAPGTMRTMEALRKQIGSMKWPEELSAEIDAAEELFKERYRDLEYVKQNCEDLADQLRNIHDGTNTKNIE